MHRGIHRSRQYFLIATAASLTVAGTTLADRIDAESVSHDQIRIVDLEGPQISFRSPAGRLETIDLVAVTQLHVDSIGTLEDLNEAERLAAENKHDQAIRHYERAVRVASSFWERLARARLIQACDRADRIELLTTHFVELLHDEALGAPLAAALLPVNAPEQSREVERAFQTIDSRLDRMASQSGRIVLEMLRFVIADRTGHDRAAAYAESLVNQPVPMAVATRAVYRVRGLALKRWMIAGDRDAALKILNADLQQAPREFLPELLLVKAASYLSGAQDQDSLYEAGWAAMRIVIHYPDDELVPEALVLAAEAHARMDRLPTAMRLIDESLRHARIRSAVRERATLMRSQMENGEKR